MLKQAAVPFEEKQQWVVQTVVAYAEKGGAASPNLAPNSSPVRRLDDSAIRRAEVPKAKLR